MRRPSPILGLCALALAGCGGHGSSGPALIEGPPAVVQQNAITALNAFRTQAGVPVVTLNTALNTAASRHAGYLSLRASGYPHFETVDGTAGGTPDTTNALYTAVLAGDRARAANAGADIAVGATYDESSCSIGGPTAIHWLWYTVYHRMPLARYEAQAAGFGDQDTALGTYPTSGIPSGIGYAVLLLADVAPVGAVASVWPPDGVTPVVERQISTDAEIPDPIAAVDLVGPPLHVILPTSNDWATVAVTLEAQGSGIEENLYILCGGGAAPSGPAYATVSLDDPSRLRPGEMVIVPAAPLQPNTVYAWTLTATTTGPETVTVGSPTPWTFQTGP